MRSVSLIGFLAGGIDGIPRYTRALLESLDRVADEFTELDLTLWCAPETAEAIEVPKLRTRHVRRASAPKASTGMARVLQDQIAARLARADLIHFFDLTVPLFSPLRPFTATLYDASVTYAHAGVRNRHRRLLQPLAARHARALVAISHFARQEAMKRFGADGDRITVVHAGPGFLPSEPAAGHAAALTSAFAAGFDPTRPYFLCVGNFLGRKNLPFVIDAFAKANVGEQLVLVGSQGGDTLAVRDAAGSSPVNEKIHVLSGIDDEQLNLLYRHATAHLLPSLYEGFGFTALEAMQRECPVIASDIPAFREISADAPYFAAPSDTSAWIRALEVVSRDQTTRATMRDRGKTVVSRYSWDATARGVCEFLAAVPLSRSDCTGL